MYVACPVFEEDDPHYLAMPADLRRELEEYVDTLHYVDEIYGEPCIWLDLDTKLCIHYEHRPLGCRQLEVGDEDCLLFRNGFSL
jgi:Fe-S-cluster containining protein